MNNESPVCIQDLRDAVEFMDNLSQDGFSEIAAIARLALSSLETPDGYQRLDDIAYALTTIWGKADEISSGINYQAKKVGCDYVNKAGIRRLEAQYAYLKTESSVRLRDHE